MTKHNFIYLSELDSLRESDEEIHLGLTAIRDEIVRNGNAVVLTYEQLADSRAFFSLMEDRAFRHDILQLFRQGGAPHRAAGRYPYRCPVSPRQAR